MRRMNWEKANAREKASNVQEWVPLYPPKKARKAPDAQTYVRYANAERKAGRKPLPPIEWIERLKARSSAKQLRNGAGSPREARR